MSAIVSISTFATVAPPWSIPALDANFAALKAALASQNTFSNYIVDTGAANAYVANPAVGFAGTLTAGLMIQLQTPNANTGASTLNYNALGAKNILNINGSALAANQIAAGAVLLLVYDGTQFILLTSNAPVLTGGTWVPSVGGTATYTRQLGTFKSMAGMTFIACDLLVNAIGTGSTTTISGLPSGNIGQPTSFAVTPTSSLSSAVVSIAGALASGASSVVLMSRAAANAADAATGVIGNGTLIQFSGVYVTS